MSDERCPACGDVVSDRDPCACSFTPAHARAATSSASAAAVEPPAKGSVRDLFARKVARRRAEGA